MAGERPCRTAAAAGIAGRTAGIQQQQYIKSRNGRVIRQVMAAVIVEFQYPGRQVPRQKRI